MSKKKSGIANGKPTDKHHKNFWGWKKTKPSTDTEKKYKILYHMKNKNEKLKSEKNVLFILWFHHLKMDWTENEQYFERWAKIKKIKNSAVKNN